MTVTLRPLEDADLDLMFAWESDEAAARMAAFTRADPRDRDAFDAHVRRIRADPSVLHRTVLRDGVPVGSVATFDLGGERSLTYWVDPRRWGQGIAGAAVALVLAEDPTRPMHAGAAAHNVASCRVLERAGFRHVGDDTGWSALLRAEVTERVYVLD